jgi:hypothetical protein
MGAARCLKNLYICGAGTLPNGVSGNPERNAAHEVLPDRSLPSAIDLAPRGR